MRKYVILALVFMTPTANTYANWLKKGVSPEIYCDQSIETRQTIFYLDQSIIARKDSSWYRDILFRSEFYPGERIQVVTIKDGGYDVVSVWDACYPELTDANYQSMKKQDGFVSLFTGNVDDRIKEDKSKFVKLFGQALTHPLYDSRHELTPVYRLGTFPSKSIVDALHKDQARFSRGGVEYRIVIFSDMVENSRHINFDDLRPIRDSDLAFTNMEINFNGAILDVYGVGYTNSEHRLNETMEIFWDNYFRNSGGELVSYENSLSIVDDLQVTKSPEFRSSGTAGEQQTKRIITDSIDERTLRADPGVVLACDTAAAHPDDPNRAAAGVPDSGLAIVIAVRECARAAEQNPSEGRIWFQYGRALWLNQRYGDAVYAFAEAADIGYAPAEKYIGDAFLEGKGLPEGQVANVYTALEWYEKSANNGFMPAEKAVTEVGEYVKKNTFDRSIYKRGDLMEHLYRGTHGSLRNSVDMYQYAVGIYEFLDSEQAMDHAPECKPLLDKMGQININLGKLGAYFNKVQNGEDMMIALAELWVDSTFGLKTDDGRRDAVTLINVHGCDTEVAARITDSLINL